MHCAQCGFSEAGELSACPSCGRVQAQAAPVAAPPPPTIGQSTIRLVVYAVLIFAIARIFGGLYDKYLSAEQDRIESELLSQTMRQRQLAMQAAQEVE